MQMATNSAVIVKCLVYLIGSVVIGLALISYVTALEPGAILAWLLERFTVLFLLLLGFFVITGVTGVLKLNGSITDPFWQECALQSANGLAALALTFTLLGISLGVGALGQQIISPQTVGRIIQELTTHFSLAFMTTVVGIPLSTLLRAATQLRIQNLKVKREDTA